MFAFIILLSNCTLIAYNAVQHHFLIRTPKLSSIGNCQYFGGGILGMLCLCWCLKLAQKISGVESLFIGRLVSGKEVMSHEFPLSGMDENCGETLKPKSDLTLWCFVKWKLLPPLLVHHVFSRTGLPLWLDRDPYLSINNNNSF